MRPYVLHAELEATAGDKSAPPRRRLRRRTSLEVSAHSSDLSRVPSWCRPGVGALRPLGIPALRSDRLRPVIAP